MKTQHLLPSEPAPHKLADWLHQQFLGRVAPGEPKGGGPWAEPALSTVLTQGLPAPAELKFTRHEIESGRIGAAVDRLMGLSDTPLVAARNASQLKLAFAGYQHDAKEVAQIPEIAQFFQAVTAHWPYWMHFLSPQADNIATLLNLTFNPVVVKVHGQRVYSRIELSQPAMAVFQTMIRATINLHDTLQAPLQVTRTMGAQLRHGLCLVLS